MISYPAKSLPGQYHNMILAKWMRSFRHGNEYFSLIHSDEYFAMYQKIIERVLARAGAIVRLAVLSDDHDVVLGWSVAEGKMLHYVFVNYEQRNKGIAKSLVPFTPDVITHLTKAGRSIWMNKCKDTIFNPFA